MISARLAHPALVSEEDFIAVQGIRAARQDTDSARRYGLAGLLRCGICGRRAESCWSNGRPAYRGRYGHSSASAPEPGRPGNLYIREDRILPHLPALYLLLTGAEPAAGRRRRLTRHGADVNLPASGEDVIGYLRARTITLTTRRVRSCPSGLIRGAGGCRRPGPGQPLPPGRRRRA